MHQAFIFAAFTTIPRVLYALSRPSNLGFSWYPAKGLSNKALSLSLSRGTVRLNSYPGAFEEHDPMNSELSITNKNRIKISGHNCDPYAMYYFRDTLFAYLLEVDDKMTNTLVAAFIPEEGFWIYSPNVDIDDVKNLPIYQQMLLHEVRFAMLKK